MHWIFEKEACCFLLNRWFFFDDTLFSLFSKHFHKKTTREHPIVERR
jgi:hypothetical protein